MSGTNSKRPSRRSILSQRACDVVVKIIPSPCSSQTWWSARNRGARHQPIAARKRMSSAGERPDASRCRSRKYHSSSGRDVELTGVASCSRAACANRGNARANGCGTSTRIVDRTKCRSSSP